MIGHSLRSFLTTHVVLILLAVVGCGGPEGGPPEASETADSAEVVASTRPSSDAAGADVEQADGEEVSLREAGEKLQNFGLRVFLSMVVLLLTIYVIRILILLLERLADRNAERRLFFKRLVPFARILVWTLAVFIVLGGIFDLDRTTLVTALAAIGVAVGFAAQDLLKNVFGGLVIVFDQPFQVGDKISIGGTYGEVMSIGLRSTRITTPDDNLVSVPNSQVVDGQVANANSGALDCQVVTDLYLPGWVDEAKAKQIAHEAAVASKYVYLNKPITILVQDEFKETFLTRIRVKAYVLDTRYEALLRSEITERARLEFRRQGLVVPSHGARAYVDFSGEADAPSPPPADDSNQSSRRKPAS